MAAGSETKHNFLEMTEIRKSFGDMTVLHDVSLSVSQGEVICIIGPSGCGKSTFLRTANWLTPADGGEVRLAGELVGGVPDARSVSTQTKELNALRARVGMVFQNFNVWPHLSVLENVVCPQMVVAKRRRGEAEKQALAALAEVGLDDKKSEWPDNLSGGQKQRLAIARVLAMDPVLVLMDEPTSALDPELVSGVLNVLKRLAQKGMTMIIVTHELGFASSVADRVVFMEEGRIVEEGAPDVILQTPKTERLKLFLEKLNITAFKPNSDSAGHPTMDSGS
ncbi:MAG: amino acid ABC transporter ATP-binding protein [Roseibium album]|uniref:Glutamine transport ATP-binding protein GlnQ n=1 Tax=Roseibium album TaxID=311410 RepID=A0A0M7A788_9HYPH|nr:amino acid ABC transporter ATP-binding protein [Roseibium album]CTQ58264.1 Glutamine transport ATP-binding protein GlnQ [Roseibium album]CTQ66008.1 Glutamine transport ATP-binding protein GlnQ [Roseibium album]CTQ70948.1 Glutamine transport ATP-binding protein GlnQ [Roseibium album]